MTMYIQLLSKRYGLNVMKDRPLTEREIDEAIKELNKNTGLITSLTYYMKPSEKRNRRNHRRRNRLKKQLVEERQTKKY